MSTAARDTVRSTVRVTWPYVGVCAALALVLHEVHEMAHTTTGRIVCGGWGTRDFNSWQLPATCDSTLPTLAGPLLTFALIWVGAALLGGSNDRWRPLGLALVLIPNPAARLLTATMGGGDEGVLVRAWTGLPRGIAATTIAVVIVAALTLWPLVRAWNAVPVDRRLLRFVALLLLPMIVTGVLLFAIGNRLLAAGVLAQPVLAGAPLLVWTATLLASGAVLALAWSRRVQLA